MYSLKEIKEEVFQHMLEFDKKNKYGDTGAELIERRHSEFYVASGLRRLQLVCDGNVFDLSSSVLAKSYSARNEYDKLPATTIDVSQMSGDELQKQLKEYSDTITGIEEKWQALLREAKKASMQKDLGRIGVEAVLKSQIEGCGINCRVEDTNDGKTIIELENSDIRLNLTLTQQTSDMTTVAMQIADIVKTYLTETRDAAANISEELKEYLSDKIYFSKIKQEEGIPPRVLNWDVPSRSDASIKAYQKVYDKVVAAGKAMDFVTTPSTREQLLEALVAGGIQAEMVDSPYSYGQQDIMVTSGSLKILITGGKTPGMLVACSPFFSIDYDITVNICVSHRPVAQVVKWLKEAIKKLSPIANKVVPAMESCFARELKKDVAKEIISGISKIPGVKVKVDENSWGETLAYDLNINDVGILKITSSLDDNGFGNADPEKLATATHQLAEMMAALKNTLAPTV